jgi:predicted RNA-binding Zn-ribbon protein involved in translation (DUF1610 family)
MIKEINWHNSNFIKDRNIKFRLKDIFADHWDNFVEAYSNLDIRPVIHKEVKKMISCRTSELGYSVYECPDCGEIKFSYHTCKSRFCPSCGNKYVRKRTEAILRKCYNCKHRHIVFTISDYLWPYFRKNRKLLDLLFKAASQTILSWFKDKYKKEHYIPGIIAVLHTYGRDMKWNPHIHTIVTEGAMGKNNVFKKFDFISYDALRKRFQKILLDLLEKEIGKKEFKILKNFIYKKSNKGFYVYAEKKCSSSTEKMIEYAVRYTGKPAMAESRIIDYDGEFITFWYQRHEDNKFIEEKIHVYEFFKRLIIHIPNENFKTVRYYGIYSKKHKFHDKMMMLIKHQTHKLRNSLNSWRMMILKDFDIDPISCPKCGNQMTWQYRVC